MSFIPKHQHPFTFEQACLLDPNTITEEIARLLSSLSHLEETQTTLKDYPDDLELQAAYQENKVVIESQKERIEMLKLALNVRGIHTQHYGLNGQQRSPLLHSQAAPRATAEDPNQSREPNTDSQSEGLDL